MKKTIMLVVMLAAISQAYEFNPSMQKYMKSLKEQAKKENPNFKDFSYERGKEIFTSEHIGKKGKKISCVSCHTNDLTKPGENISTGKKISPLSPYGDPKRFTKVKNVKKWLRRNFNDVYQRAGSAQEKGDVIIYIVNQK